MFVLLLLAIFTPMFCIPILFLPCSKLFTYSVVSPFGGKGKNDDFERVSFWFSESSYGGGNLSFFTVAPCGPTSNLDLKDDEIVLL